MYETDASGATVIMKSPKGADILRDNLNNDRQVNGMSPLLPPDCEPHHIVLESDNRKGIRQFTSPAREILESCDIDINSSINGIFLPSRGGVDGCDGSQNHRTIHNGKYYEPVLDRLKLGLDDNGCQGVKDALVEIKRILVNGGMP